ncbi:hypothetical protein CLHOM_18420 [Clostridium homopropionicum DSM 5847]|uniref:Uncharacterized protein n=1 Tax=Clostridium homopropionicum DSM 5847 TaxID=1121318 RepID=A0A0L6ZAF4_9CLOT|nr:hypothetical protein [Clostridium homopropionicum]KOA19753.1 hypothetical protein CLHOM_18420 [Clostridium homopropionicum DSM 5847]SFF78264.1 hypothetical protein SAMN04488501_102152 [Clostridium homopropionicum]
MKFKKKSAMLLSFVLGTTMLATTAIAEISSKSGYVQLKDSLKYTADAATSKLSSYTMDMSFVAKADGKVISSEKSLNKYDLGKQATETTTSRVDGNNKSEYYYYSDKNVRINKSADESIYFLTEFTSPKESKSITNPFNEKGAEDIEIIADILVGNLKDAVIVTEQSDGGKELSGSISESQIPALINAIVSFQCKNEFSYRQNNDSLIPRITKDIFVKEITGKMIVDKDGLIQSINGTGALYGKDENGKEHTITFELSGKLYDVNSTTVTKPDLSGKKVEKNVEKDFDKLTNPSKYIGKYKTDIIIEKDGKFAKIGEKVIDITQIDETTITGKYYEEYTKGYEEYSKNKKDFNFSAKFQEKSLNAEFTATTSSGNTVKGNIYVDQFSGKVHFNINENRSSNLLFDGEFSRVFE